MVTVVENGARAAGVPKTSSGIAGLDAVLFGGYPTGRATLVGGGPGTGKTVLALEFLYEGAVSGEPAILVTFEESAASIRRNAATLGWDLAPLEQAGKLLIIEAAVPTGVVQAGDFDIGGLLGILAGHIRALGARRIVIDAADLLLRLFRDPGREEDQLIVLHNWLLEHEQTVLLTVKTGPVAAEPVHRLEYLTDCVLRLDHRVFGQVSTRRLRVIKFRGSGFLSNEYPYLIAQGGFVLMPISGTSLTDHAAGPRFASGVAGFDDAIHGGFFQGSSILVGGASGTGKTLLGCSMGVAACNRGERVLYVSFEESAPSLVTSVRSIGLHLDRHVAAGTLRLLTSIPEALGVEEHLWRIYREIDRFDPRHVFVDAISACQRMGSHEAAFDFLVRLLTYCKARGTTCIYVNQTDPDHVVDRISGVGISSLIDALIVLRQEWNPAGDHRREALIVKIRGSSHSHRWTPFRIGDAGLAFDAGPAQAPSESAT